MELGVLSKHNNNTKKIQMNWIIHRQRKIMQKTLREQSLSWKRKVEWSSSSTSLSFKETHIMDSHISYKVKQPYQEVKKKRFIVMGNPDPTTNNILGRPLAPPFFLLLVHFDQP